MSQQCPACPRWFKNKQAIRRHLGYCPEYKARPRSPVVSRLEGVCAACGRRDREMKICTCGGRLWIPTNMGPAECPSCRRWHATAVFGWKDRCPDCGAAMAAPQTANAFGTGMMGTCVACGRRDARMRICECGGREWIPDNMRPMECPACGLWQATVAANWNGYCRTCEEPLSSAALREELEKLRRLMTRLDRSG